MAIDIRMKIHEVSTEKTRPDGSIYRSLSFVQQAELAQNGELSQRRIQLLALEQGIVPECYARNQKSLSNADQIRLLQTRVAIVGLGGLGGTVTEILARIGIGQLRVIDGDRFDESNLNRQLLSSIELLGRPKAEAAVRRVQAINPAVEAEAVVDFMVDDNAAQCLTGAAIAVDCLDSIASRFVLERACHHLKIPLVSAAIAGTSGQATVIYPEDPGLSAIYGDPEKAADKGVEKSLGTLSFAAVALAAMECAEVVALATGRPAALRNKLLVTDISDHMAEIIELGKS
jgi:molybdopterin/thiamine biosynthesis adenylyltransferase